MEKEINSNGVVLPDDGFDGFSKVNVNVSNNIQSKSVTINSTNSIDVIPDNGYDYLSKVTVNASYQTKTYNINNIGNKQYQITPDSSYAFMNKLIVNVSKIKINSISFMNDRSKGNCYFSNLSSISTTNDVHVDVSAQRSVILVMDDEVDWLHIKIIGNNDSNAKYYEFGSQKSFKKYAINDMRYDMCAFTFKDNNSSYIHMQIGHWEGVFYVCDMFLDKNTFMF